jgi:signal transduction histidine kinase
VSAIDLELLPDAVVITDADGRVTRCNQAAATLLGRPPEAVIDRPLDESLGLSGPGDAPALPDPCAGFSGERDLTVRRPDGTTVRATATARASDAGTVLALRPSDEKSGIGVISTVAHELRSPLTSVKGYTSLMLNRWDRLKDDQKRMMLAQVHDDADRVTRLVTELLDISRLETGRLVLRRQLVDLPQLAAVVVDKVRFAEPDLECSVEFPDDCPRVYADPDKVSQVLTNLVENAAKYGDPQGMRVVITAEPEEVRVAVRDAGRGIPPEDLPRVFTKFFRRDHGRPTGTGLGLWISRGLVEAHGGELSAESRPGEGATFRFSLPTDSWDREFGDS